MKKVEESTSEKKNKTFWADVIKIVFTIMLIINCLAGLILLCVFLNDYHLDDIAWLPLVIALLYGVLFYPLIMGYSKVVAAAEKKLQS